MEMLTASETAIRLRISRSMVYLLAQRGVLPCVRFGEHAVRFPADALDEWVIGQISGGRRENTKEDGGS